MVDFVAGAAVAVLVVLAGYGYKRGIVNRFRALEEDVDDINELLSQVIGGGDE